MLAGQQLLLVMVSWETMKNTHHQGNRNGRSTTFRILTFIMRNLLFIEMHKSIVATLASSEKISTMFMKQVKKV